MPYNETSAKFSSGWKKARNGKYFMGTSRYTMKNGAAMNMSVNSNRITVVVTKLRKGGKFQVFVDGKRNGTATTYSRATQYRQGLIVATFPGAPRVHKVKIVAVLSASKPRLEIDGIAGVN